MQKRTLFIILDVLILTAVFLFYFYLIFKPSESILRENIISDFKNEMRLKVYLIDNAVSRYIEGGKSMSSRSMIRNKIIEYKNGKLTLEQLKMYTMPKYIDGAKALDNCIYAARYVDGKQLINYKNPGAKSLNITLPETFPDEILADVHLHDSILNVLVISPIKHKGTVWGHDVLYSSCTKLIKSIADANEKLEVKHGSFHGQNILNNNALNSALRDTIIMTNDSIEYRAESNYAEVYFSLRKSGDLVFFELNKYRNRQVTIMLLIIVAFALLLYIIQKRAQLVFLRRSLVLENLVNEKTADLNRAIGNLEQTNIKLAQRENELTTSNQTKDKFFSIIAHDLINPMNSLMGLSDILTEKFDTNDVSHNKELIKYIRTGLSNTLKLLENLLTWSRLQRGIIEFSPEQVNLHEIVRETIDLLKPQALNKNQKIYNLIPQDTRIYADPEMITTVVRNLLSNAIKFTDLEGKIKIGVNTESPESDNYIEVYFKDNGIGMTRETIDKLFKIHESTSKKGTAKETGTGLGLILCKEFIEKHNGKIRVESVPGEGSIFKFLIPVSN